jgi:hypothetical protein
MKRSKILFMQESKFVFLFQFPQRRKLEHIYLQQIYQDNVVLSAKKQWRKRTMTNFLKHIRPRKTEVLKRTLSLASSTGCFYS